MKQWAEQTLPKLKEHLTKATGLAGTKTGTPKAGNTKGRSPAGGPARTAPYGCQQEPRRRGACLASEIEIEGRVAPP